MSLLGSVLIVPPSILYHVSAMFALLLKAFWKTACISAYKHVLSRSLPLPYDVAGHGCYVKA